MGMLFELIAVEGDLQSKHKKGCQVVKHWMNSPAEFQAWKKTLKMLDDSRVDEEKPAEEMKQMAGTVPRILDILKGPASEYFDVLLNKELGNQEGKADIVIDSATIATDLPVPFLLGMERRLQGLMEVYEAIPVLDPSVKWEADTTLGDDVYQAVNPQQTKKTEKVYKSKITVETTEPHPAQTREWTEDVMVGVFTKNDWSGAIHPADKSAMIERLQKLIKAFKEARQRANSIQAMNEQVGETLFNYIHGK